MTKKTIFIAVELIVILNITAFSQNFRFRLLAGVDLANVKTMNMPDAYEEYDEYLRYYPMIAYNLNGDIEYRKSAKWGLAIQPGFIQKGGRDKRSDGYVRYNLNYIQLPVLFNYYFADKFYLSIGPELSYMMSAKVRSKDNSVDITDWYDRRTELSGLAGINYKITDKLAVGLRYNHGLTYIYKNTWMNGLGEIVYEPKHYNQYMQLIVKIEI